MKKRTARKKAPLSTREALSVWINTLLNIAIFFATFGTLFLTLRIALRNPAFVPVLLVGGIGALWFARSTFFGKPKKGDALIDSIERETEEITALVGAETSLADVREHLDPLLANIRMRARDEHDAIGRTDTQIANLERVGLDDMVEKLNAEKAERFDRLLDALTALQHTRDEFVRQLHTRTDLDSALAGSTALSLGDAVAALGTECDLAERVTERLAGEATESGRAPVAH